MSPCVLKGFCFFKAGDKRLFSQQLALCFFNQFKIFFSMLGSSSQPKSFYQNFKNFFGESLVG
tara:strand:- start:1114 stop:1302 length:189 start_codon:yes stop_codon:yes gene_type:complete